MRDLWSAGCCTPRVSYLVYVLLQKPVDDKQEAIDTAGNEQCRSMTLPEMPLQFRAHSHPFYDKHNTTIKRSNSQDRRYPGGKDLSHWPPGYWWTPCQCQGTCHNAAPGWIFLFQRQYLFSAFWCWYKLNESSICLVIVGAPPVPKMPLWGRSSLKEITICQDVHYLCVFFLYYDKNTTKRGPASNPA